MKIRNGFVSNSSSASFVIMGIIFDNKDDKITYESFEELLNELELDENDYIFSNEYKDKKSIIGFTLGHISSEENYLDDRIFNIQDVTEEANKLISNLPISEEEKEIKIITGTMAC